MIQRESSVPRARQHKSPEGPVRTCVGCRKRELAADLIRVAAVRDGDGETAVTVDAAGNLPGRGAWLHSDEQCLHLAVRRRAFARALRITGSPNTSAVVEFFANGEASVRPATEQVAKNMSTP
ncbi:YlxR family protein [Mycobacterium hodleri]|uniref:YlxR family protein n=1 Tax=Mycolicibacterium hodleri TaxID=49897 RepID=UPI0021F28854|nr:YlxR family protein [Mycolicibacterium hodleri]MCV7132828.1 YlxR family protein [Mycolicibacterium hodleri]